MKTQFLIFGSATNKKMNKMGTVVITPSNGFYNAFLQCMVLREYDPNLKISLCGFCLDEIERKLYYNTLKENSIDVSHLHLVKNVEQEENCSYSDADWKFIMQHGVLECYSYDVHFQEIVKHKQSHQFLSVHFNGFLGDNFSNYYDRINVLYVRTTAEYYHSHYSTMLKNCSGVFVNRIADTNEVHIFYKHKHIGTPLCYDYDEEYSACYRALFTYALRKTNNAILAKHDANTLTRSLMQCMNVNSYKKHKDFNLWTDFQPVGAQLQL